nr:MAG TPA: hypothetical protein [Caudoviricetes sp.]
MLSVQPECYEPHRLRRPGGAAGCRPRSFLTKSAAFLLEITRVDKLSIT